jgi:hypothetical protein
LTPEFYRQKAARCRELLAVAVREDVKQQLRLWIDEFEELAAAAESAWRALAREAVAMNPISDPAPVEPIPLVPPADCDRSS